MTKKFFRCHVCGAIYYGNNKPSKCPDCLHENSFIEIDLNEARKLLFEFEGKQKTFSKKEILEKWQDFSKSSKTFKLTSKKEVIERIFNGEIKNLETKGLRYCPCQLVNPDKGKKFDEKIVCPCNFFTHKTWKEKGSCICGLFEKK